MSIEAHLSELERRHASIDQDISVAEKSLTTDPLHINELKRKKLQIKDQISRLRNGSAH
ncbi:YdcH family protein [Polycladidibacter hongkongensis]|uniref:YdcH family protein n=1 Tax=Polycladidibacter hongkongensis TaxID=1647556 RepID=UPI0009EA904E|nr:DUF465 domain-containing protein [Pseudovibrio hongkongensis]